MSCRVRDCDRPQVQLSRFCINQIAWCGRVGTARIAGPRSSQLALYICNELCDSLGIPEEMHLGLRGMPGNGFSEAGHALSTIGTKPAPEVGAFGRSAQSPPGATEKREVQENDRICRLQPHLSGVIRTKIAVHDPVCFAGEVLL